MDEKTYEELTKFSKEKVKMDFDRLSALGLAGEFNGRRCVFETMSNGTLRPIYDLNEIENALKITNEVWKQNNDGADRVMYAIMKTQDKYNKRGHIFPNAEAIFNSFRAIEDGVKYVTRDGDAREIVSDVIDKDFYDLNFEERVRTKAKVVSSELKFTYESGNYDNVFVPWRFPHILLNGDSLVGIDTLIDIIHLNYQRIVGFDKNIDLFEEMGISEDKSNFNYFPKVSLIYAISCMEQFIPDESLSEDLSPSLLFHNDLDELKEIAYRLRTYVEATGKLPMLEKDANDKISTSIDKEYLRKVKFDESLLRSNNTDSLYNNYIKELFRQTYGSSWHSQIGLCERIAKLHPYYDVSFPVVTDENGHKEVTILACEKGTSNKLSNSQVSEAILALEGRGFDNSKGAKSDGRGRPMGSRIVENPMLDSASYGGNDGNKNSYNDDCVVTLEHTSLDGVKLMVVADGVGGSENGYLASTLFSVDMQNWFNNLNASDLQNNDVSVLLANAIKASDRHIADVYSNMHPSPCTVASCVLIANDNTYVSTVGDTRVYLEQNGQLNAIKRCENHLDKANKLGVDIAFDSVDVASRAPEGYIGYGSSRWDHCNPIVDVIPTVSYDGILAVTDGVYKDVDDANLNVIFEGCYSDDVAESICALAHNGEISPIYDNIGYRKTDAGVRMHDDASVAVYKKYAKVRTNDYGSL